MLGMSHHTDPLRRSLNLYSSVMALHLLSVMAVQHHTCNSVCSLYCSCFSSPLSHNSSSVLICSLLTSKMLLSS
jgi:hypothetical protein